MPPARTKAVMAVTCISRSNLSAGSICICEFYLSHASLLHERNLGNSLGTLDDESSGTHTGIKTMSRKVMDVLTLGRCPQEFSRDRWAQDGCYFRFASSAGMNTSTTGKMVRRSSA